MRALIIVVLAIISWEGFCQPEVSIGTKLGLNVSTLNYSDAPGVETAPVTRYHVGLYGRVRWGKVAVQPEFLYSREGGVLKSAGSNNTATLDYISFPVLAKWYIVKGLNVQAGPHIGFTTQRSMNLDPPVYGISNSDLGQSIHNMNYGAVVGVGLELPLGLSFDARYCFGVMNVSKIDPQTAHLNVFQFSAGYRLFKI